MKEAQISREIVGFLRTLGFAVYDTGQGYRKESGGTRITPGLADLIVIGHGLFTFVEVKTAKGKLRPSQEAFRDECIQNGVPWQLWRDVREAWDWAADNGIVEEA